MSGVDAVVVAAGGSSRMGGVDKLRASIGDRPLLGWTLAAIAAAPAVRRVVVVTAPAWAAEVRAAPWLPRGVAAVVEGGRRRQDSVAAGVAALGDGEPDDVVLVHDGARPLVTPELVERVADAAGEHGAAIPAVEVAETLKRVDGGRVAATVDRAGLAAAQTPQGVRRDVLARAWALRPPGGPATWTDEAGLLEACRIPVHVVAGDAMNLKVTYPGDLARVQAALVARGQLAPDARGGAAAGGMRVGLGEDAHPFGPGKPLLLGGVTVADAPRLHGHSDGDVALHAVCDALLGAAALGDLGRLFPAGPATPAGIAGSALLGECLLRVRAAGYVPVSIDLTLVGARPRLAGRLDEIAVAIAALVGLGPNRVNVKASTGNLAGFEGAGRGIAARAVAVVVRREDARPGEPDHPADRAGDAGARS